MALGHHAYAVSFCEIAQSAALLLDGLIFPGDAMVHSLSRAQDGDRFCELDKFYLPLTSQLNARRDNIVFGPWADDRGPFSCIFHHLRCLSGESSCQDTTFRLSGFKLNRVSRCFSTKTTEWVGERRISIAVVSRFAEKNDMRRCNSLLFLSPGSDRVGELSQSPDEALNTIGLERVMGEFAPVFIFLVIYAAAIGVWSQHWWHFVRSVENLRQDDVRLSAIPFFTSANK